MNFSCSVKKVLSIYRNKPKLLASNPAVIAIYLIKNKNRFISLNARGSANKITKTGAHFLIVASTRKTLPFSYLIDPNMLCRWIQILTTRFLISDISTLFCHIFIATENYEMSKTVEYSWP